MLRILGKTSSINVRKVLWLCDELSLAYDREDWGKGPGFRSLDDPEFVALNPNRLVPVIVDDGFVLWDSQAILRYLARKHRAEELYPSDVRKQALVDQWMNWNAAEFNSAWRYAFMALVRKVPGCDDQARIAASIADWNKAVGLLDDHLATSAYLAGEAFTLADICVALALHRWRQTPIAQRPDCPRVEDYMQRISERRGYRNWCTPETP